MPAFASKISPNMDVFRRLIGGSASSAQNHEGDPSPPPPLVTKPVQTKRQFMHQVVTLAMIVCSALMIWKGLVVATGSESPIVVVLSGSMEPGFYRGDILFLNRPEVAAKVGDIVVYNTGTKEDIPIVHRITRVHAHSEEDIEDVHILTKGDNNYGDDVTLYPRGMYWLQRKHVLGTLRGFLPYVGMATIIMNDYPMVKYGLIGLLAVTVIFSKDDA